MTSKPALVLAFASALALGAGEVSAQTLYKLIDKNGKVTYSESAPKQFDGKVIRMDIDPNANTATLPKPRAAPSAEPTQADLSAPPPKQRPELNLKDAREKLERAQKALADAKENPRAGELNWIGNVGGGARAVPSEGYTQRLQALEQAVLAAQDEVRLAEENR
jgi:hypothetical protein